MRKVIKKIRPWFPLVPFCSYGPLERVRANAPDNCGHGCEEHFP